MYINYEYTRTNEFAAVETFPETSKIVAKDVSGNASTNENKKAPKISGLVVLTGIEPVTHGFSVRCSTN